MLTSTATDLEALATITLAPLVILALAAAVAYLYRVVDRRERAVESRRTPIQNLSLDSADLDVSVTTETGPIAGPHLTDEERIRAAGWSEDSVRQFMGKHYRGPKKDTV